MVMLEVSMGFDNLEITLRPIETEDFPFLFLVYAGSRAEEMSLVDWNDGQKDAFLRMQFDAQHRYYHEHYRKARFDIVELDCQSVGRFYVDRTEDEIRVVDITILPELRGNGLGGVLLRQLLAEATFARKSLKIHVAHGNPALNLYERLGFIKTGEIGCYDLMVCPPPDTASEC